MMGRSLRNAFMVVSPPFYYFLGNVPHKNCTGLPFFVSSVFLKRNIFLSSITFSQMDFCAKRGMLSNIQLQTKKHKYYPLLSIYPTPPTSEKSIIKATEATFVFLQLLQYVSKYRLLCSDDIGYFRFQ